MVIKKFLVGTVGSLLVLISLAIRFQFATIKRLLRVNSLFSEKNIVRNFSGMRDMFFHVDLNVKSSQPLELQAKPAPLPESFQFRGKAFDVSQWKVDRAVTAMVVLRDGQITHEEYLLGTSLSDLRISWSMAKSFLSAAFGIAVEDGLLDDLDAQVVAYVPTLKGTAYDGATIRHVLNMAGGIDFNEDYLDYHSDINRMGRVLALGYSMDGFASSMTKRAWEPGSLRKYVSIDTHVIGMVLRSVTGQSASDYLSEKLLKPLGLEAVPYYLTDGLGTAFVLGGLNLTTRDYARFGLLFMRDGNLNGKQIVPQSWVQSSTQNNAPQPTPDVAATDEGLLGYGYQWWLPPEATEGEFFAIGIYGQYIYVNRPLKTVIAVNSADRNFKDDAGRITLENLALFRTIAETSSQG